MIEPITSSDNPKIKLMTKLSSSRTARKKAGLFIVEGLRHVQDLIDQKSELVDFIIIDSDIIDIAQNKSLIKLIDKKNIRSFCVNSSLFKKVSTVKNSSGLIAIAKKPIWDYEEIIKNATKIAILDRIQNPSNSGAIIRNAAAFKIDAVFVTAGSADSFHPESLRAMAGNCFQTPIIELSHTIIELLNQQGFNFILLDSNTGLNLGNFKPAIKNAFVFGSEGTGLSAELLNKFTNKQFVNISISKNVDSLNVAVSSGIIFWNCCNKQP
jgi:RNA methyltransferase, TrmH family